MSGFREPGFADRQKAAQQAKKNLLEKFRAQPGADDPAVAARRAEREVIAANREKAQLAREAAKAETRRREEEAAALRERTPVVALTADANQGIREACQEAGMDGFLTKPIDPAELDSVLQTLFQPDQTAHRAA